MLGWSCINLHNFQNPPLVRSHFGRMMVFHSRCSRLSHDNPKKLVCSNDSQQLMKALSASSDSIYESGHVWGQSFDITLTLRFEIALKLWSEHPRLHPAIEDVATDCRQRLCGTRSLGNQTTLIGGIQRAWAAPWSTYNTCPWEPTCISKEFLASKVCSSVLCK